MIDFKKLKNEKIAIYFETEKEMKKFLKECDKENICWCSGQKASDLDFFDAYKKFCISMDNVGLSYGALDRYIDSEFQVICYKQLSKVGLEKLTDINRIVRNKKTTVVFWDDDTKTIVKLGENQEESPEMAILWAYFEKHCGLSKTQAHKEMAKLIDSIYNQDEKKAKSMEVHNE